jgi:hypothetical protein
MKAHFFAALGLVAAAALWPLAACDDSSGVHETPPADSGPGQDTGPTPPQDGSTGDGPAPSDCFTNPQTHFEIINACTNSQQFDKKPNLPLLLADGGLPALPQ